MDANLAPLMLGLLVAFSLGMGYVFFSAWRLQRAVAWNVVAAVLTLRNLKPDQVAQFRESLAETLNSFKLTQEQLDRAEPDVRYAFYAEALRRKQIQPTLGGKPFNALRSPLLARSSRTQIKVARIHAETEHATVLTELDVASSSSPQSSAQGSAAGPSEQRQAGA